MNRLNVYSDTKAIIKIFKNIIDMLKEEKLNHTKSLIKTKEGRKKGKGFKK